MKKLTRISVLYDSVSEMSETVKNSVKCTLYLA